MGVASSNCVLNMSDIVLLKADKIRLIKTIKLGVFMFLSVVLIQLAGTIELRNTGDIT